MSKEKQIEEAIPADAVIQALKCCASAEDNCCHCPFKIKGAGIISESCITAMSRAALDLIYRKQIVGEWIRVEERLPEVDGRQYLVWDDVQATVKKRFFYRIPPNIPLETYPHIREYFGNVSDHKRFTHWMPLPEPPKGDRHE